MRQNDVATYRHNIGTHYNQTHGCYDNRALTNTLTAMAEYPGDPVARCRASLVLHALLFVSNSAQAGIATNLGLRRERRGNTHLPACSDIRPAINQTRQSLTSTLINASGRADIPNAVVDYSRKKTSGVITTPSHAINPGKQPKNSRLEPESSRLRYSRQGIADTVIHKNSKSDFVQSVSATLSDIVHTAIAFIDGITRFPVAAGSALSYEIPDNRTFIIDYKKSLAYSRENTRIMLNEQTAAMEVFLQGSMRAITAAGYSKAELIRALFVYLENHQHDPDALAKTLLGAAVYYGGGDGEYVSPAIGKLVVRRWLQLTVLGKSFEDFIVHDMIGRLDCENETLLLLGVKLREKLLAFINIHFNQSGQSERNFLTKRLWKTLFVPEFPALTYWRNPLFNYTRLNDFALGEIHAGLMLAHQGDVPFHKITWEEAADLGKFIQLQIEAGIAPPDWLVLFNIPALLRCARTQGTSDIPANREKNSISAAMKIYFNDKERYLQENNPFYALSNALENYQTRPQLAEKILNTTCPYLSVSSYLYEITPICYRIAIDVMPAQQRGSHVGDDASDDGGVLFYGIPVPFHGFTLPDIDKAFLTQNKALGQKYAVVERLLLVSAWAEAFGLNERYWTTTAVNKVRAQLPRIQPRHGFRYCAKTRFWDSPVRYTFKDKDLTILMAADVELFTVQRPEDTYLYLLSRQGGGYAITFIGALRKSPVFSMANRDTTLCLSFIKALKSETQNFENFIDALVNDHTQTLENKLHAVGYEKHPLYIAKDFILSLIPFYSCLNNISEDPIEETLFDCGLDILSLIPALGQISRVIGKSGLQFYKGMHLAGKNALVMAASRKSLRDIATQSIKTVVYHSMVPASQAFKMEQVVMLAREMVYIIDPGFNLLYFMSKQSLQGMAALSRQIDKNLPNMKKFFEKIPTGPQWLKEKSSVNYDYLATFRATKQNIGVKKLDKQKYHGREIFALVNLDSGLMFGPKLFLTKNHNLKIIPLKFGMRIRNILEQGMSGRGAPRAAAQWKADVQRAHERAGPSHGHHDRPGRAQLHGNFNQYGLSVTKNEILGKLNGQTCSVIYDLSYNVFYRRKDSLPVSPVIDKPFEEKFYLSRDRQLQKWGMPFISRATPAEQIVGIKALGVDLRWPVPPFKILAANKKEVPKKITSIWVGNNDMPENIIAILQNNALQAKRSVPPYSFKLYLSSSDESVYQRNLKKITTLAKNVVVINLEYTDYFAEFKQTKYFEHYLTAINGNNGAATNFASACDVLRLYLVNRRGGLYLDVDDIITQLPSNSVLRTTPDGLVLSTPVYHTELNIAGKYPNSNWATHPGNPTLKMMLEESYRRYQKHPELYRYRPSDKDKVAFRQYAGTLSYVSGPNLFNHIIDKYLPVEKQSREVLKLLNFPVVMVQDTYNRLEGYLDRDVCVLKNFIDLGNAHTWRYNR